MCQSAHPGVSRSEEARSGARLHQAPGASVAGRRRSPGSLGWYRGFKARMASSSPQVSMVPDVFTKRTRRASEEIGQSFIHGFSLPESKPRMENGLNDDLPERHSTASQVEKVSGDARGLIANGLLDLE